RMRGSSYAAYIRRLKCVEILGYERHRFFVENGVMHGVITLFGLTVTCISTVSINLKMPLGLFAQ
ncbi:hypothetical protein, partial [Azotobacter vinelandii]|uniref:hypothetical protein n=1 Tax=Azotobacter vinelandii TaxID=354 RepID=UPI0022F2DA94